MGLTFFLLCSLLTSITYCAIELTVTPEVTRLSNDVKLIIRCSLNLLLSKTDQVYSILMRRRNTTLVVVFTDSTAVYDKTLKDATVNSSLSTSDAYLQLTLPTVTCDDRGDYSCSMAVRQNHRSLEVGPVEEYLKMTGESCQFIDTFIYPMKAYKTGDLVRITCFMLVQYASSDWHWSFANNETVYKSEEEEGCQFVAKGVMNCSSLVQYEVTGSSAFTCQLGNAHRTVTILVEDNVVEDTDAMSRKPYVEQRLPCTSGQVTHFMYTTYLVVGTCSVLTIATILIALRRISNRRHCSSADTVNEEEAQLSKRLFTKEDATIDTCEKKIPTFPQKSDCIV